MPVLVQSLTKGEGVFSIEVDQTTVTQLFTMVDVALTPPQLAVFMKRDVQPYLAEVMVDRFAYNGTGGTTWAPLAESTRRIRQEMGVSDDWAINERTGDMLEHLISHSEVTSNVNLTTLTVPGDQGDEVMQKKIKTAQEGHSEWNPLFEQVTHTPARPVLDVTEEDTTAIVTLLQMHVMNLIGALSTPLGSL
jgi:hypothetical protein